MFNATLDPYGRGDPIDAVTMAFTAAGSSMVDALLRWLFDAAHNIR